ncbi:MAG: EAL domain-containing protein [Gemmataceae bacterium]|nr:EAL domain-containing protein [Gemmataceae bacterium]
MAKPLRTLLIDDSEPNRVRVVEALQRGGFDPQVRRVDSLADLREALGSDGWRLVLANPHLPEFEVMQVLAELRAVAPDAPVLLLADDLDAETAMRLMRAGARNLVRRSNLSQLAEVVAGELADAESRQWEPSLHLLANAAESAANAMFITNSTGDIEWTNAAFRRLSGYGQEELLGQNLRLIRSGVQPASFYEHVWKTILAGEIWTGEVVERSKEGSNRSVHQTITPIRNKSGEIAHFIGIHEDVARRKEAEARIKYLSYHDELTGLPNRTQFHARLDHAQVQARDRGKLMALHVLDLLQFKVINDTLGHGVGDLVLQEVAKRLQSTARHDDAVCRIGGDEFAIIQTELSSADATSHLAARLLQSLDTPFHAHGQAIHVSATLGISIFPLDDPLGTHMLRNAEAAMTRARSEGQRQASFSVGLDSQMRNRRELEVRLLQAIENDEMVVHYQPQVELAYGAVIGMEALVRWQHPTRGLLYPGSFLPDAEASGVILPLSDHVIRKACNEYQTWFGRLPQKPRLAINISASHLRDDRLLQTVANALHESGMTPGLLELELTETALIRDESAAAKVLAEFSRQGILISIDDFGTGYSSLSYLKHLSIQKLKIDQSFVRNLPHDPDDAAIVRGTIALGHELGLKVIAEGVETADHVAFLKRHGCDEAQGYHYFRPTPADKLRPMLQPLG